MSDFATVAADTIGASVTKNTGAVADRIEDLVRKAWDKKTGDPPQGKVQVALDQLKDAVDSLAKANTDHGARIAGVLGPPPPTTAIKEAAGKTESSPLAEILIELSDRLYAEVARIRALTAAVDL